MDGFSYACAVLLAAVFVRAGATKLARPRATEAGFAALHLPAPATLSRAIPLVELAVAVGLLALPAPAAVAALVMLVAFTAVIAQAVRSGEAVPCTCFGTVSTDPVGRVDILRNGLLAALAVAALDAPGPSRPSAAALALLGASAVAGLALLRLGRGSGSRRHP